MDTKYVFNLRNSLDTSNIEDPGLEASAEHAPEGDFVGLAFTEQPTTAPGVGRVTATQFARNLHPTTTDSETLTSVTIKQLHDAIATGATNEPVKINNIVIKHITVVARVIRLRTALTKLSLLLDDCSAAIEAVYLLSPDDNGTPEEYAVQRHASIMEGMWIRVIGILCLMDGETKISVIRMRPVHDSNEVVFHRLDTVKTFLEQTNMQAKHGSTSTDAMMS